MLDVLESQKELRSPNTQPQSNGALSERLEQYQEYVRSLHVYTSITTKSFKDSGKLC